MILNTQSISESKNILNKLTAIAKRTKSWNVLRNIKEIENYLNYLIKLSKIINAMPKGKLIAKEEAMYVNYLISVFNNIPKLPNELKTSFDHVLLSLKTIAKTDTPKAREVSISYIDKFVYLLDQITITEYKRFVLTASGSRTKLTGAQKAKLIGLAQRAFAKYRYIKTVGLRKLKNMLKCKNSEDFISIACWFTLAMCGAGIIIWMLGTQFSPILTEFGMFISIAFIMVYGFLNCLLKEPAPFPFPP